MQITPILRSRRDQGCVRVGIGVRLASSSTASKYCSSPVLNWQYTEQRKIEPKLPVTLTHTPNSAASGCIGMQMDSVLSTKTPVRKHTHPGWDDDPALGNFVVKSKAPMASLTVDERPATVTEPLGIDPSGLVKDTFSSTSSVRLALAPLVTDHGFVSRCIAFLKLLAYNSSIPSRRSSLSRAPMGKGRPSFGPAQQSASQMCSVAVHQYRRPYVNGLPSPAGGGRSESGCGSLEIHTSTHHSGLDSELDARNPGQQEACRQQQGPMMRIYSCRGRRQGRDQQACLPGPLPRVDFFEALLALKVPALLSLSIGLTPLVAPPSCDPIHKPPVWQH
ncbi:GD17717 [Drosophila simulans]|uniref:GD17717 n=1 Tax=Drosophila simulans TaxID=7240 RepID=B4NSV0_DROSI|nr:GD17717 [Drosophila simulans]